MIDPTDLAAALRARAGFDWVELSDVERAEAVAEAESLLALIHEVGALMMWDEGK